MLSRRFFVGLCLSSACMLGAKPLFASDTRQFAYYNSDDWKFLTIARSDMKRARYLVTAYEVLRESFELRELFEIPLITTTMPKVFYLGCAGRFLVTVDEWFTEESASNAIVVYDLLRRENSSFKLEDIFGKDAASNLGVTGPLANGWFRGGE